jgi:hypothetical protein
MLNTALCCSVLLVFHTVAGNCVASFSEESAACLRSFEMITKPAHVLSMHATIMNIEADDSFEMWATQLSAKRKEIL